MKWRFNEKRKNKPLKTGDIISDFLKEFNLENNFSVEYLKDIWADITGEIISSHSRPDRIYHNTLFIKTDHSVFANDITMMSRIIIKKLHDKFSNCPVKAIKVEIKKDFWI
ncbi:MAG: DUF721 domain-containing protein [Spirochaetes bacterium]|nr:DUF721 domain-containing protein [Spirochaetota bacterium]